MGIRRYAHKILRREKPVPRQNERFAGTLRGDVFTLEDAINNIQETALARSEIHGVDVALARQRDVALRQGHTAGFGRWGPVSKSVLCNLN